MRPASVWGGGVIATAVAMGMGATAWAQEAVPANGDGATADSAARLAAVEKELAELRKLLGTKPAARGDDDAAPTQTRRSAGGVEKPLLGASLGGYFSLEYFDPEDADPFFDQHRLVLFVQSQISDFIEFDAEIEIEGGGADVPFLSGNEILVEYAELRVDLSGRGDSPLTDLFVLRAGLILVPFGKFNFIHDDPLNDLTDRPLLTNILPIAFDQPGVGMRGALPLGTVAFNYDVALIQGLDDGIGNGGARGGRQSFRADNNKTKDVVGRFGTAFFTDFGTVDAGVSGWYGKYDPQDDRPLHGWAFDVEVRTKPLGGPFGPIELLAEVHSLSFHRRAIDPGTAAATRGMDAYYVQLNVHVFPECLRGGPFGRESTFTLVARYEENDFNTRVTGASATDDRHGYTFGVNVRFIEKTVLKLSWQRLFLSGLGAGVKESLEKWAVSFATYF